MANHEVRYLPTSDAQAYAGVKGVQIQEGILQDGKPSQISIVTFTEEDSLPTNPDLFADPPPFDISF